MNDGIRPIDDVNIFRFLSADGSARELTPDDNSNEFTVIWLDEQINTSVDCLETKRQLRDIFTYSEVFTDDDTCLDYVMHADIKNQKIFFIVSGILAMKVISRAIELPQIVYIYIFCQISSDHIPNGEKVRGTFVDKHTLFATLTQDVHQITQSLTPMSMFCSPIAQEQSIINTENGEFDSFQSFLKVIINTSYSDSLSKEEMIQQCRCYYRRNKYEQKKIDEFEATYTSKDAVYWYTKNSFIYRLLNKALRTRNIEIVYAFRYFFVDLYRQIHELHWKQVQSTPEKITTLYRGQLLPVAELQNLTQHIGEEISMNSFVSTSRSSQIAFTYCGGGRRRPFLQSVVFQIDLITDKPDPLMPFCSIEDISCFKEEGEYLFKVGTVFQLISIDEVFDGVWLIQIKLTSICNHSVYQTIDASKHASKHVLLDFFRPSFTGNIETEDTDLLIDEIPSKYCDLMSRYISVGEAYGTELNYFEQLECYKMALQIYEDISNSKQSLLRLGYYAITRRLAGRLDDWATTLDGRTWKMFEDHCHHKCSIEKYSKYYQKIITRYGTSTFPDYHCLIVIPEVILCGTSMVEDTRLDHSRCLENYLQKIEMVLNTYEQNYSRKKQLNTNSPTITVLVNYQEPESKMSETITYKIRTNETIAAFIRSVCTSTGWTYKWRLQLLHKSRELRKDATLADFDIQNEAYLIITQSSIQIPLDILNVIRNNNCDTDKNTIQVHIQLNNGDTMTTSLSSHEETVQYLKYRIYDYSAIHIDDQRLIYAGTQLIDNIMLSRYNVQDGSTIDLICRQRTTNRIPTFSITDEHVIKTINEKTNILRRTIQEVRESYNDVSVEAKRNALRSLKEKLCEAWRDKHLRMQGFCTNILFISSIFLSRTIRDYDRQNKLLQDTKC